MLLRRFNLPKTVKSFSQTREGLLAAAIRSISTSEGVKSDVVTNKEKISPIELDQRQKLKKTISALEKRSTSDATGPENS